VLTLRAEVALNGLGAADVDVEAVFGSVDGDDLLTDIDTLSLEPIDPSDGISRYEGEVPLERTGAFGYTVRVLPKNRLLASPAELGVVATA
jgi:starch phosphorylase